ncbi:increased DNA methylation 3-like isoform X2 [Cornus florida]|uniref:increased DNA methylation 3-like isoform X2 n=1 Tax=Cornus florida TaxID=4283 RepID=UPI0028967EF7|nr:increased DNA methylation 3-like isoform X2 [Cornus florida]
MSSFSSAWSLDGTCMMPLLSIPDVYECSSKESIIMAGTARRGGTGPSVGAVDIGVSKFAYYFRVALPGVKKDPGQFSCEIEPGGKVHVRGVTSTGGRTVSKHSRVFEMKFQQQCPPGPFTLSFCLPGPVDPRLFSPNFRSDGILEGVVVKYK